MNQFQGKLLDWYEVSGRDLPWRRSPDLDDPYRIWTSEVMLQQTQVKTVLPYYHRWFEVFPTVESLAIADQQQVLKAWEGLGYYSRARNFHRAAKVVVEKHGGQFPQTAEAAEDLPGIGRTTAGGILSNAFDLPVPILDGNVKRVLSRLIALPVPPAKAMDAL
ncbi:MAG: A/G-specific adenine glycosylase, partial [Cyanobacteria bacterium P01_F01_bin.153]